MSNNGYFATIPVRFFVYSQELDDQGDDDPIIEVNEHEFLKAEGQITYERHTKAENGVSQICLTKMPD
jgi:hypothetical protein